MSQYIKSPTLEDYMQNPPDMEWVNGQLLEKNGMTLKHGRIQLKLGSYWKNYMDSSGQGEVYTDVPVVPNGLSSWCCLSYACEPLAQFGNSVIPPKFLLVAEIISPTDEAEEVFAKPVFTTGCQEVSLVLPETVSYLLLNSNDFYSVWVKWSSTQTTLQGFSVAVKNY